MSVRIRRNNRGNGYVMERINGIGKITDHMNVTPNDLTDISQQITYIKNNGGYTPR